MSSCSNCGMEVTEGAAFCANCGAAQAPKTNTSEQPVPAPETGVVTTETVETVSVEQPVAEGPAANLEGPAKTMGIISLVCGILSIIACCGGPLFGIAAIILAVLAKKKAEPGVKNTMATVGLILGIVGIALGILSGIIGAVTGLISGFMSTAEYGYYY